MSLLIRIRLHTHDSITTKSVFLCTPYLPKNLPTYPPTSLPPYLPPYLPTSLLLTYQKPPTKPPPSFFASHRITCSSSNPKSFLSALRLFCFVPFRSVPLLTYIPILLPLSSPSFLSPFFSPFFQGGGRKGKERWVFKVPS